MGTGLGLLTFVSSSSSTVYVCLRCRCLLLTCMCVPCSSHATIVDTNGKPWIIFMAAGPALLAFVLVFLDDG